MPTVAFISVLVLFILACDISNSYVSSSPFAFLYFTVPINLLLNVSYSKSIVNGITLTVINLIGYSAMAGTVGGGGLGDVAIRYGYQRYRVEYMLGSVAIILILVEIIQVLGTHISNKMQAKR